MSTYYVAVIEKDADSAFGVWFPDVEGCFSAGDSLEEAVANAAAALRQHTEALESAGQRLSAARSADASRSPGESTRKCNHCASDRQTRSRKCGSALSPVPAAVPPMPSSHSSDRPARRRAEAERTRDAQPPSSCPNVIGTAS